MAENLKISFYGDDFTGSADVMESLSFNGTPTALFLEVPTTEELDKFRLKNKRISQDGKVSAIGIPGIGRSLTPAQMDEQLPIIFEQLAKLNTDYFHYKICSTFDSSPHIGNIGHAVQIALKYFPSKHIPLVVGIPLLKRYCVFGNLFAKVNEETHRLDKHPTMSKHPITPMNESNLSIHLGKQTNKSIHLIDVLALDANEDKHPINQLSEDAYILFDVLKNEHLNKIGDIINRYFPKGKQLLVGSSAIEYALTYNWMSQRTINYKNDSTSPIYKASKYIIISGSCSPKTAEQINYAINIGFKPVKINIASLIKNETEIINLYINKCIDLIQHGHVPIIFSALGPDDPSIEHARESYKHSTNKETLGTYIGKTKGKILKHIINDIGKELRVTIAGGDTSGHITKSLGIYALEVLHKIAPGVPLCIAHANNANYDGLEICLKGGQNGSEKFFESVLFSRSEYN